MSELSRPPGSRRAPPTGPAAADAVIWHDVECAGYDADLALWRELAELADGALLDLGAGTGRVALDLAEQGHDVTAVDCDPALLRALTARARARELRVRTAVSDVRALELGRRFQVAIAPMQVAQLLGGERGRRRMLASVRRHLHARGLLAVALADPLEGLPAEAARPPLPDVRELDGWVFSSTPVALRPEANGVAIDRRREAVSPTGELAESIATVRLDRVTLDELESAAERLGYRTLERRRVPATHTYVGSTIVLLEAA